MSLSIGDVYKIARLARLGMTEQEAEEAHTQLLSIFSLIAEMQAVVLRECADQIAPQPPAGDQKLQRVLHSLGQV